jgi:hypothetical protein
MEISQVALGPKLSEPKMAQRQGKSKAISEYVCGGRLPLRQELNI